MFGLPPEAVDYLEGDQQATEFEVIPDNWETVAFFLKCETQWRVSFSGPTGLDYTAVESLFRIYGIDNRAELFDKIRIMENAALGVICERAGNGA